MDDLRPIGIRGIDLGLRLGVLNPLETMNDDALTQIERQIKVMTIMIGFNLAMTVAILLRLFLHP